MLRLPLSQEDKDAEVGVNSEFVSSVVITEAMHAIVRRVRKLDRDHDIPYTAGYSRDGGTIYIDRHMPKSFLFDGRRVETDRFLIVHEVVEKALLDELGLHYVHAHQIALRTEQAAVRAGGVGWHDYNAFMMTHVKSIDSERVTSVPADLDLAPYRDEQDFALLKRMVRAED